MRLIDADALRASAMQTTETDEVSFNNCFPYWQFSKCIKEAPTIDAVPVVRYNALLKRFRHLLESDFIRSFDEWNPITNDYRRDITEADKIMYREIYIAHPFGGQQENVEKVEKIIKGLLHKHPDCTFYSPLHATGFMYSQLTYLDGMEHCFEALSRCDELWIAGYWRDSRGCNMEYGYAKAKGIPIKFIAG